MVSQKLLKALGHSKSRQEKTAQPLASEHCTSANIVCVSVCKAGAVVSP